VSAGCEVRCNGGLPYPALALEEGDNRGVRHRCAR
jgi:hypothetical protein